MEQNERPYIIAGPCSVESREQLLSVSEALCRLPRVHMIRGGVWKPRTRPGSFEGLGEPALRWMKEISDSDMRMADGSRVRFCCEVARPEHVELCQHYGIHTVWLGARTTANPFMVEEISKSMRNSGMSVMVKNPVSPDVRLWLGAIERLQQAGLKDITAIHRGFYTYNTHSYRNDPLWEIALELRHQLPETPILCDPSHMAGSRELVAPLVQAALQLDYDGLMVEVHPSPSDALTDAAQQITPDELQALAAPLDLPRSREGGNSRIDTELKLLRSNIDDIDHKLLHLLAQRMQYSRQIATLKREVGMTVYQQGRWGDVLNDRLALATQLGINPDFTKDILETIHGESVRVQME